MVCFEAESWCLGFKRLGEGSVLRSLGEGGLAVSGVQGRGYQK